MAALLGIVASFVGILFCSDLLCAAEENSRERISVPESEHFCAKVMSGHFERIQLVTINQDMILEPSYRVLHVSGLNENHTMTLNDTSDGEVFDRIYIASLAFVKDWFQNEMDKPIKRLYPLEFGFDRFKAAAKAGYKWAMISAVKQVKLIYVAFTDSAQYTLKVWPSYLPKGKDVELLSKQPISIHNPEYALLYKYKDENSVTGYVIQNDSQTGNFIIYDFSYDGKPAPKGFWGRIYRFYTQIKDIFTDSKLVKPEDLKLDSKVYYFMEKTDNPHEIRLVHGYHTDANGSTADRQLFRDALPNGFQYNGSQYLFDGSLGCVYVIQNFESSLTQQFKAGKVDFRLKRLNIPYEQYFKCPDMYKLADDFDKRYKADRCDSVIGEDGSIDRGEPVEHSKSTVLNWTLIGLVCLLFMAALVVLVVVFWKKVKTRKIDKKKRPIGSNDLESASKSNKTLTTSGTKSKKSSSSGSSATL